MRARYTGRATGNPSLVQPDEVVTILRQGKPGSWHEGYGLIRRDVRPWTTGRKPRDRWMPLDDFEVLDGE